VLLVGLISIFNASVSNGQTVLWDANSEPDLAGYRLSYGTQPGNYTTEIDVGNQTQYQPPAGFDWSRELYFAVRAYNTSGLLSPFSAEVKWTPPTPARVTSLVASTSYPLAAGQPVTWTATASGTQPLQYRFWMYRLAQWVLVQDYSTSNTLTWTPSTADIGDPYAVQVWARCAGSTANYESWLGTPSFAVTGTSFELQSSVDFPTPPGNQVTWTAHVGVPPGSTLEYRFLVRKTSTSTWTVFREYATSNTAQWTPTEIGTYVIEAWARHVGSTAQYDYRMTTANLDVSQTALSVTSISPDTTSPTFTGIPVKWTARVRGGSSGPIQYQFWIRAGSSAWQLVQPYGPSETFTWTPALEADGTYTVQVWVRNNGSTAAYEAWRSSAPLTIQRATMSLTTATQFPVAPGSQVDWTASVADSSADLQYQFWLYTAATGTWDLRQPYSWNPVFTWLPVATGNYVVQAWARQQGSTASYEFRTGTGLLSVTQGPAQIVSVTSDVALPAPPGTAITWTVGATGGYAGPLQYQFWRWSAGQWRLVQDYSDANTYSWTPTSADIGTHALQVWVRSAGSPVTYEAYRSTGVFSIQ
jgi:hypothetical protein